MGGQQAVGAGPESWQSAGGGQPVPDSGD